MAAAHYWGRKPSELGLCEPDEDASIMFAYYSVIQKMNSYNALMQEEAAEKARVKGHRRR